MIGALRHEILLMQPTRTTDSGGGATSSYEQSGTLWAQVEWLTPIRDVAAERRTFLKRILLETRVEDNLQCGAIIQYSDSLFEVVSIETVDERQRRLIIVAEEVISP